VERGEGAREKGELRTKAVFLIETEEGIQGRGRSTEKRGGGEARKRTKRKQGREGVGRRDLPVSMPKPASAGQVMTKG
jgi:hypothetical protein